MTYFGLDDQIFNVIHVEDQTVAIFNWEWWKICLLLGLYFICASVALCGQVMIIIYIAKYAPKGRAINEMILVDQVKLRPCKNSLADFCTSALLKAWGPSINDISSFF